MRLILCLIVSALVLPMAHAQTPVKTGPSPELAQLDFLAGKWACESKSPKTYSYTTECRWSPHKLLLVCEVSSPAGESLWTYSYNANLKALVAGVASGSGVVYSHLGSGDGSKWTFSREATSEGKPVKYEFRTVKVSPTHSTYSWHRSLEGGPWTQTSDGACQKRP